MTAATQESGDKAKDGITRTSQTIASEAEMARMEEESRLQAIETEEKMAGDKLGRMGSALTGAVANDMANIYGLERAGAREYTASKSRIEEMEKVLDVEHGSLRENQAYLQNFAAHTDAAVLAILATVVGSEMHVVHEDMNQNRQTETNLVGAQKMLSHVTQSEAFQALKTLAMADELAIQSGSTAEELTFWLHKFDEDQKGFNARVQAALGEGAAFQQLMDGEMEQ